MDDPPPDGGRCAGPRLRGWTEEAGTKTQCRRLRRRNLTSGKGEGTTGGLRLRRLRGSAPRALPNGLKPTPRSSGPSPRRGRCAGIALARASPAQGPAPDPRGALGGAQRPASSRAAGLGRREGRRGQTKRLMNGRARRAVRSPRARAAPRGAGASGECARDASAASSTAGAAPGSGTAPLSVRGGPGGGCVPWVHPAGPLTAAPRAPGGPRPAERRGSGTSRVIFHQVPGSRHVVAPPSRCRSACASRKGRRQPARR